MIKNRLRAVVGSSLIVIPAVLALCAPPAAAQNNSLLGARHGNGGNGHAPATSQPAAEPTTPLLNGSGTTARATLKADRPEPKPNAVLLQLSPFSVSRPNPEKIKVNDLVTIIVRESKTATSNSKLESKKDWKLDGGLTKWINFNSDQGVVPEQFPDGTPGVALTWNNDYKGDGTYDRKDELTTRVTARVIDVKPNGNLVLEAKDEIRIDDEGYTITLVGECRSQDVTPQNTVLSTQISDRTIDVQHAGAVRDATRRGWLQRTLDLLRTF